MSFLDRIGKWLSPASPTPQGSYALEEGPMLDALRTVMDPELNIDIVAMGLVRSITLVDERIKVVMTLSTRGCPVGPMLVHQVTEALAPFGEADVEVTFDPPWTRDDMRPEGRAALAK